MSIKCSDWGRIYISKSVPTNKTPCLALTGGVWIVFVRIWEKNDHNITVSHAICILFYDQWSVTISVWFADSTRNWIQQSCWSLDPDWVIAIWQFSNRRCGCCLLFRSLDGDQIGSRIAILFSCGFLDSKVHGTNMGPIWVHQDPGGPHVGPMNFAIWDHFVCLLDKFANKF